jgi:hypothetical protein
MTFEFLDIRNQARPRKTLHFSVLQVTDEFLRTTTNFKTITRDSWPSRDSRVFVGRRELVFTSPPDNGHFIPAPDTGRVGSQRRYGSSSIFQWHKAVQQTVCYLQFERGKDGVLGHRLHCWVRLAALNVPLLESRRQAYERLTSGSACLRFSA